MKRLALGAVILAACIANAAPGLAQQADVEFESTDEEVNQGEVEDTTRQFMQESAEWREQIAKSDFFMELQPFGFGAKAATVADIRAKLAMPNLGEGSTAERYDVVLQPGHYLRKPPGKMGTSGAEVTEQQLVAFITANVARQLIDDKMKVLVVSADEWTSGLNANIFLSIHADGTDAKCTTGPSLGYGKGSSLLGMHGLAFALATSMGQSYEDFMKDNFTTNLSQYYMFKHVKLPARGFSGVLEVGELTCPASEKALVANALLIARNLGVALAASNAIIEERIDK